MERGVMADWLSRFSVPATVAGSWLKSQLPDLMESS